MAEMSWNKISSRPVQGVKDGASCAAGQVRAVASKHLRPDVSENWDVVRFLRCRGRGDCSLARKQCSLVMHILIRVAENNFSQTFFEFAFTSEGVASNKAQGTIDV
jgi:hypothetical protein